MLNLITLARNALLRLVLPVVEARLEKLEMEAAEVRQLLVDCKAAVDAAVLQIGEVGSNLVRIEAEIKVRIEALERAVAGGVPADVQAAAGDLLVSVGKLSAPIASLAPAIEALDAAAPAIPAEEPPAGDGSGTDTAAPSGAGVGPG